MEGEKKRRGRRANRIPIKKDPNVIDMAMYEAFFSQCLNTENLNYYLNVLLNQTKSQHMLCYEKNGQYIPFSKKFPFTFKDATCIKVNNKSGKFYHMWVDTITIDKIPKNIDFEVICSKKILVLDNRIGE